MSYILSIETGTEVCSVALSQDGELISLREVTDSRAHAKNLAVFVDEILSENNLDTDELAAVAVSKGPGSYTGLRIGVSLAKGICYATGIPLIGVPSLDAMAQVALEDYDAELFDIKDEKSVIFAPMIDARRMEVYTKLFNFDMSAITSTEAVIVDENSFVDIAQSRQMVIFGTGAQKCQSVMSGIDVLYHSTEPSARGMVKLAHKALESGNVEDIAYFEPFYLKDFVAGVSKKNPLIK